MGMFFGVVGAGTVDYWGARVVATIVDIVDDWRYGWPRWKSGDRES